MKRFHVVFAASMLLAASPAAGREYAPRVLSPHVADAYSMATFAQFPRWRNLQGDRRAWEIYRYLADKQTGLFHMNEVCEGADALSELSTVRDPVKIINVYGYAYCAILGPVMEGVCQKACGWPARTLSLPDWRHVAAEAFYDDRWHYLDIDVRAVFRRPDGRLASLAEARSDPNLWRGPRSPLFFPNDPLEPTRRIYVATPVHHYHDFFQSGHTMDYVLRQGETFTRWWKPQGGRWLHLDRYNDNDWLIRLIEQPPRGPKPNHRHFTVHNHGNGRFAYEPNLTAASSDFLDGVDGFQNLAPGPNGLRLRRAGEGWAVWRVRSPYVIVPRVGSLTTREDDREASVVQCDPPPASWAISLDEGRSWRELPAAGGGRIDLTPWVSGRYGYLLRCTFRGEAGQTVLRRLRLVTWVQVAPASLPALRAGVNRMRYVVGDHHGLRTRVVEAYPDTDRLDRFAPWLAAPPEDYDPQRRTQRFRGSLLVRVDAPPGSQIAWFSVGASFRTYLHEAAAQTANRIAYAMERPEGFRTIYQADVPRDTEHWHYNADCEVRLERPARTLYVRYDGQPALNRFRIYAHCLDDDVPPSPPVRIAHVWRERGRRRQAVVRLAGPGEYDVRVGAEPENESIEIAVPSR